MKRLGMIILCVLCTVMFCACGEESKSRSKRNDKATVSADEYEELQEQLQDAKKESKKRAEETEALRKELATAKEDLQWTQNLLKTTEGALTEAKKQYEEEHQSYIAYKEKMADYEKLSDAEREAREAEARMTLEREKQEQQKREQEAEAQRKKEEEERKKEEEKRRKEAEEKEKKGYETGITYDQLARTPDKYKNEKVKFTGEILQVLEGDDYNEMRLSVHKSYGYYDSEQVLYCIYNPKIIDYRLLEGDEIIIYGTSYGVISYESVMGQTITLPAVIVDKLEQKK